MVDFTSKGTPSEGVDRGVVTCSSPLTIFGKGDSFTLNLDPFSSPSTNALNELTQNISKLTRFERQFRISWPPTQNSIITPPKKQVQDALTVAGKGLSFCPWSENYPTNQVDRKTPTTAWRMAKPRQSSNIRPN
ncbi:hypothetical protein LIER_25461 [Lithospermum erythrorhizon]|uniref:Uncharacterized protein n=1 Tax=Lithospermum erythrorhizon TaxID=34254 RepID=A0AAV3R829_LITER